MTKKTKKGKTILKPKVPTKLTNNIGKSAGCFTLTSHLLGNHRVSFKS